MIDTVLAYLKVFLTFVLNSNGFPGGVVERVSLSVSPFKRLDITQDANLHIE